MIVPSDIDFYNIRLINIINSDSKMPLKKPDTEVSKFHEEQCEKLKRLPLFKRMTEVMNTKLKNFNVFDKMFRITCCCDLCKYVEDPFSFWKPGGEGEHLFNVFFKDISVEEVRFAAVIIHHCWDFRPTFPTTKLSANILRPNGITEHYFKTDWENRLNIRKLRLPFPTHRSEFFKNLLVVGQKFIKDKCLEFESLHSIEIETKAKVRAAEGVTRVEVSLTDCTICEGPVMPDPVRCVGHKKSKKSPRLSHLSCIIKSCKTIEADKYLTINSVACGVKTCSGYLTPNILDNMDTHLRAKDYIRIRIHEKECKQCKQWIWRFMEKIHLENECPNREQSDESSMDFDLTKPKPVNEVQPMDSEEITANLASIPANTVEIENNPENPNELGAEDVKAEIISQETFIATEAPEFFETIPFNNDSNQKSENEESNVPQDGDEDNTDNKNEEEEKAEDEEESEAEDEDSEISDASLDAAEDPSYGLQIPEQQQLKNYMKKRGIIFLTDKQDLWIQRRLNRLVEAEKEILTEKSTTETLRSEKAELEKQLKKVKIEKTDIKSQLEELKNSEPKDSILAKKLFDDLSTLAQSNDIMANKINAIKKELREQHIKDLCETPTPSSVTPDHIPEPQKTKTRRERGLGLKKYFDEMMAETSNARIVFDTTPDTRSSNKPKSKKSSRTSRYRSESRSPTDGHPSKSSKN